MAIPINNFYEGLSYLPPQQVLQVDGRASVEKIRMAPNSTLLALDRTNPIIWFCSSDGVGNVTATPFDYTKHEEEPEISMSSLQSQLNDLKTSVSQILEVIKDGNKPNSRNAKSKSENTSDD